MKLYLDPQVQAFLEAQAQQQATSSDEQSIETQRNDYLALAKFAGPIQPVEQIENRSIQTADSTIPLRIYRPAQGLLPAIVYFHGGAFFKGNLETHDRICRALANASGCVVVSVDYRLAPENPFPAAPDDAYAATQWIADNAAMLAIDPSRLAVAGDSAGGGLAAIVARRARDAGAPNIAYQILLYPPIDSTFKSKSWHDFADGPVLTLDGVKQAKGWYLANNHERKNPDINPLLTKDLSGLPPALIITAEYDPLRDEGEAYAHALQRAGVPVKLTRYQGMIHGFFQLGGVIDAGQTAMHEIATTLRTAFGMS